MILKTQELEELLAQITDKQKRFAAEYVIDLNGNDAAVRAGYRAKSARSQASRLLTNDNIIKYVQHLSAVKMEETKLTAKRVINEIAALGFATLEDYLEVCPSGAGVKVRDLSEMRNIKALKKIKVQEMKDDYGNVIGHVKELELNDKTKNLDMLGKHFAIFTENVDLTSGGEKIENVTNITNVIINHRKKGEKIEKDK